MIVNVPTTSSSTSASLSVWKQERLVFKVQGTANAAVNVWTNLHGNYGSPMVQYTIPSSGVLYVDMSDYARAYAATLTKITLYDGYARVYTISFAGLINPDNVIIPPHWQYAKIVPPDYIIAGESGEVIAEFYDYFAGTYMTSGAQFSVTKRTLAINEDTFELYYTDSGATRRKKYQTQPKQCGRTYALVRWVSFTGQTRTHWLEVVKAKTDADAGYDLLPIDNEYVEIKGRVDGFTLRLDGLTAYDMWYYADMVTSSKVEVSLDGTNYDRVQVSTKTFTQPDGENNDGKLEINVNWKRYDAVAM